MTAFYTNHQRHIEAIAIKIIAWQRQVDVRIIIADFKERNQSFQLYRQALCAPLWLVGKLIIFRAFPKQIQRIARCKGVQKIIPARSCACGDLIFR